MPDTGNHFQWGNQKVLLKWCWHTSVIPPLWKQRKDCLKLKSSLCSSSDPARTTWSVPASDRELQEPHKELAFEKKPKRTTWSWLWGRKRKPSQMP